MSFRTALKTLLPIGPWLVGTATAFPVQAQGDLTLEEVIVTAQKRQQSLQDVPVSVSAVSGEQINDLGLGNLQDMAQYVPNLTINQTPGATQVFIRGLGSGDNQGFESSVGMFIDGVYAGRAAQFETPFVDVGAVEVLRGPQGTLFGKNTIAGAITIDTARPTDELEMILRTSYEVEYEDYSVEGVISGPLTDTLSGRFTVREAGYGGYLDNTLQNRDEVDGDESVVRGSLLWDASEDMTVFFKYEGGSRDLDGKPSVTSEPSGWEDLILEADPEFQSSHDKRSTDFKEFYESDNDNAVLKIDWALGEYELTSITGYSEYDFEDLIDADTTSLDVAAFGRSQDFDQFSQELRLTSPLGETFDFIAGLYYLNSNLEAGRNLGANPAGAVGGPGIPAVFGVLPPFGFQGDFSQDTETFAVFAAGTWHPTDRLHINLGLRYTYEEKEAERSLFYTGYLTSTPLDEVYEPGPVNSFVRLASQGLGVYEHQIEDDRSSEDFSPSLRISYDLSDDTMLYFSASKAFKSGGFNEAGSLGDAPGEFPAGGNPASFEFDEEEAHSFEVGGKMSLFDRRATLNFAVFRTEFDNLQVSTFQGDSFVVGNAAEAVSQGAEVDGVFRLTTELTLSGSLAYLDAEYDDFKNATCTVAQADAVEEGGGLAANCAQDLSGAELAYSPEWTAVLGLDYETYWGEYMFRSRLDIVYTDEQYLASDLDSHTLEDSRTLLNARVALAGAQEKWEIAVVGKNLTDEEVRSFSNDPFLLSGVLFSYMAPPRTVELQLNLHF